MISRYQQLLYRFHSELNLDRMNYMETLRQVAIPAAKILNVTRLSFWEYFEAGDDSLETPLEFDEIHNITFVQNYEFVELENPMKLSANDFPQYFEAILNSRQITAIHAHVDPATSEFSSGYLKPLDIHSMLDIPIRVAGKVVGVICAEYQRNTHEWTMEEVNFAASLGDILSRSYLSHQFRIRRAKNLQYTESNLLSLNKIQSQYLLQLEAQPELTKLAEELSTTLNQMKEYSEKSLEILRREN